MNAFPIFFETNLIFKDFSNLCKQTLQPFDLKSPLDMSQDFS